METQNSKKTVALLSNVTVDLLAAKLKHDYDLLLPPGYDTWVQEALNPMSQLRTASPDAVVLLLDGTVAREWSDDKAVDQISTWKFALTALAEALPQTPVFATTVDLRMSRIRPFANPSRKAELEADWISHIRHLTEVSANVYAIDLADVICDAGRQSVYSDKMWYISGMPYSREGLALVASEIHRALEAAFEPRKKVVVLDLDNTLWGGVVGEDGVDGIELSEHGAGQRFRDFQRCLREMKAQGALLAVNSKNNAEDAQEAIDGHPSMLLRDGDFVAKRINWESKASNMKSIEAELNITEGGFVFVDDNPMERAVVAGECSDALVPDFPEDTSQLHRFVEELYLDHFRPLRVLSEDGRKTEMYRSESQRREAQAAALDMDSYIASLEMRIDIHRMRPEELKRVAQLSGKTNQFNLTTRRYTEQQIAEMAEDPARDVFTVHVSDKYGDSGLVSVLITEQSGNDARIDEFLMSCRVMGRKVEDVIVDVIADSYDGKERILAEYAPTKKNVPVADLYDRLGFELTNERDGHKEYRLALEKRSEKTHSYCKEILFEGEARR